MSGEVIICIAFVIVAWSLVGVYVVLRSFGNFDDLNPIKIYKSYKVNYFGCFILTILFNIACPIGAVIYWVCKFIKWIMTVGRK